VTSFYFVAFYLFFFHLEICARVFLWFYLFCAYVKIPFFISFATLFCCTVFFPEESFFFS